MPANLESLNGSPLPVQKPSDLQPSPMAFASSIDRGATTSTPGTYVESISSVWSNVSFKRYTFAASRCAAAVVPCCARVTVNAFVDTAVTNRTSLPIRMYEFATAPRPLRLLVFMLVALAGIVARPVGSTTVDSVSK